jgi:hypothetical protein
MDCATRSYLAGFFDGEGCIGIYRQNGSKNSRYLSGHSGPSWCRQVSVANCHRDSLVPFKNSFGGQIRVMRRATGNRQQIYSWQIKSRKAILYMLRVLLPRLHQKQAQAKIMIEECRFLRSTESAAKKLKQLKHI